jgi:hypothetical protein
MCSVYQVNKICYRAQHDPPFREALRDDPARATADLPLTDDERAALLAGDVARLHQLGAHDYLLGHLPRFQLLGLTRDTYTQRMKSLLPPDQRP